MIKSVINFFSLCVLIMQLKFYSPAESSKMLKSTKIGSLQLRLLTNFYSFSNAELSLIQKIHLLKVIKYFFFLFHKFILNALLAKLFVICISNQHCFLFCYFFSNQLILFISCELFVLKIEYLFTTSSLFAIQIKYCNFLFRFWL